jgi:hypothetical protein
VKTKNKLFKLFMVSVQEDFSIFMQSIELALGSDLVAAIAHFVDNFIQRTALVRCLRSTLVRSHTGTSSVNVQTKSG